MMTLLRVFDSGPNLFWPKLKNFLPKLMDDLKQYSDQGIDLGRL